jgi:uncharacterized glyoxalase superfamily protein PhnB
MGETIFHPILFYKDAPAALQWLHDAFGFEELFRVPDESGGITHAEMHLDGAIIMVSSTVAERGFVSPRDVDGKGTMHANVYVPDPDAVHARALAAGATITFPLEDKDYGGRGFSCTDLEGHGWSFGSYKPAVTS